MFFGAAGEVANTYADRMDVLGQESAARFTSEGLRDLEARLVSLEADLGRFVAENAKIKADLATVKIENDALRAENAELKKKIADLTQSLAKSERAGKRQSAPFSRNKPKTKKEKPGRKSGDEHGQHGHRPLPEDNEVDEHHHAELPGHCPQCGHDQFTDIGTMEQFQEELPRKPIVRKITIHTGTCCNCQKRVHGRHPLQTTTATGACSSQLGPDAQAAIVYLNKHCGMSYGKISQTFDSLFGIEISRGGCAQVVLRAGKKLEPAMEEIKEKIKQSDHITPDETGWRIGGQPVWLHAWVGDDGATLYTIDPHRKADALERLIGIHWSGDMTHDGCSSYDRFESAGHQQCVDHALRRARKLAEQYPDRADFPQQVIQLLTHALHMRDRFNESEDPSVFDEVERRFWRDDCVRRLTQIVEDVAKTDPRNEEYRTFAKHLSNHISDWFLFLTDATITATNHRAEQALKTPIVNRKVFGGNQTEAGARAQESTSSVLQTCKNGAISIVNYLSDALCGCIAPLFA